MLISVNIFQDIVIDPESCVGQSESIWIVWFGNTAVLFETVQL